MGDIGVIFSGAVTPGSVATDVVATLESKENTTELAPKVSSSFHTL
jgi:hypothetical protein